MATLEEYKAKIKFTKNNRVVMGKKKFTELHRPKRSFDHLIIASLDCKEGKYTIDKTFNLPNEQAQNNNSTLKKMPDKSSRYSNVLEINKDNGTTMAILNIEFDIANFNYLFELTQVEADLLNEDNDEMTFEIYTYFVKYEA